jgi:tripartite-type tricarboxylate transporter receptor subunit TctC
VIVENRAGAGGNVGAEVAARAPADGYTIMLANNSILAANAALYPKLNFDPARDFLPVTLVAVQPNILVVHPSLPVKSVKELVALAKRRPGQLNYASSGVGLAAHLAGELFNSMAGVEMVHVPYKGAGPALADLIGGQTQVMFATATSVIPHIKSGKLRALATTAPKRSIGFEDLPTVSEAGVPGFDATSWHGIVVPTGTPRPIVEQLSAAINAALKNPDLREKFLAAGAEPVGGTPEQFAAHIKVEVPRWEQVIRQSGAKAN